MIIASFFGFAAAVIAVTLFSEISIHRPDSSRRRILGGLAVAAAGLSALLWSIASGGEAVWVHWLISLSIGGPPVVVLRSQRLGKRGQSA